jgi:hypothetical protein
VLFIGPDVEPAIANRGIDIRKPTIGLVQNVIHVVFG